MKDTLIQFRATTKEKEVLTKRAASMFMTLSEYLIHAGICYQPSEKTQKSLDHLHGILKKEVGNE